VENTTHTDELVVALGNLINVATTLQSIILGGIGGVERDRALAHFDNRLQEAARLRERIFGDPAQLPPEAAVEPVANSDNTPTLNQAFDVTGRT
jgi:hypothetical protein